MISFQAIGTEWRLYTDADCSTILPEIYKRIEDFDATYSRFRKDSLVTKMSLRTGTYKLPGDAYQMLRLYEKLYRLTDGKLTPLIGQTMNETGYDAEYSLRPSKLHKLSHWDDAIESYSTGEIIVKRPALLDFGAAGKGYLVDLVAELLDAAGLESYTIDASGDILHRTSNGKDLRVGMENPLDTSEAIGVIKLANRSLCASAGSKRKWGKYHHIINPQTLRPADEILATWAIADDTMTADGIATALFFTEPARLQQELDFTYARLHPDMRLECAQDFPAEIFKTVVA